MSEQPERIYETLLSKYIAVWLWSILFSAISGVVFTFIAYRPFEGRWRAAALLSALLIGIGLLASLASLLALYRGLVYFLIPQFLLGKEADPERFAYSLNRALLMLIVAALARITMILIDSLLSAF
ncbi:MAG TPA: hypothetical protein VGW12_07785 [Pyrinomonadaceae bacterium]|nr:hypothetical protein [Pyrinomonadaceae bacterium]